MWWAMVGHPEPHINRSPLEHMNAQKLQPLFADRIVWTEKKNTVKTNKNYVAKEKYLIKSDEALCKVKT